MDFDLSVITEHWYFLGYGIAITLALALASGLASLALGVVIGLARLFGPRALKPALRLYVGSRPAVAVLVVLVWTFFAPPIVTGLPQPRFAAALIRLTV